MEKNDKELALKIVPHKIKKGANLIEVWDGDEFVASIYPTATGVKLVSKHIADDPEGAVEIDYGKKILPIPSILIKLKQ